MYHIVTGRYNNETWEASRSYRERKHLKCIYAPPCRLAPTIPVNTPVFVIEMNNSTNQIMGIGLIRNKLATDRVYIVQKDTNCNRYIYIGKYHMSRELLLEYVPHLVDVLDRMLFKGKTHSKRGFGLTKIPEKVLQLDMYRHVHIKTEIKRVFAQHFQEIQSQMSSSSASSHTK
jgi:hypothetical protein